MIANGHTIADYRKLNLTLRETMCFFAKLITLTLMKVIPVLIPLCEIFQKMVLRLKSVRYGAHSKEILIYCITVPKDEKSAELPWLQV